MNTNMQYCGVALLLLGVFTLITESRRWMKGAGEYANINRERSMPMAVGLILGVLFSMLGLAFIVRIEMLSQATAWVWALGYMAIVVSCYQSGVVRMRGFGVILRKESPSRFWVALGIHLAVVLLALVSAYVLF